MSGCSRLHTHFQLLALSVALALPGHAAARAPKTHDIRIISEPPRAMVYVDGQYRGLTPIVVKGLAEGYHLVRLTKEMHRPWSSAVQLPAKDDTLSVRLAKVEEGTLKIEAIPVQGEVFIDGRQFGETPLVKSLPAGSHHVKVRAKGYEPWKRRVEITHGKELSIKAVLRSRAEEFLKESLASQPWRCAYAYELAHIYALEGKYDEALRAIENGLKAAYDPRAPTGEAARLVQEIGRLYQGQFKFGMEDDRAALRPRLVELVERVWKEQPRNLYAAYELATLYRGLNRVDDALAVYRSTYKALKSARAKRYIACLVASFVRRQASLKLREANKQRKVYLAIARRAKKGKPANATAAAKAKAEMERLYKEYIQILETGIKEFPDSDSVLSFMIQIATAHNSYMQDKKAYMEMLRRIIERFPHSRCAPTYLRQIAADLWARKEYDKAIKEYRRYLKVYADKDDCPSIREKLAAYYRGKGERDSAIREYETILKLYPSWASIPGVLLQLKSLYEEKGLKAKAKDCISRLVRDFPHRSEAATYDSDPKRKLARKAASTAYNAAYAELQKLKPIKTKADSLGARAAKLRAAGKPDAAIEAQAKQARAELEKAVQAIVAKCNDIIVKYPWTYDARNAQSLIIKLYDSYLNDPKKSIEARNRFIQLFPRDNRCPSYRMYNVSAFRRMNEIEAAIAELKRFVADYPDNDQVETAQWQAATLSKSLKGPKARERYAAELNRFVKLFPRSETAPRALYYLAMIYYYQAYPGDKEKALEAFARLEKEYPHAAITASAERYRTYLDDGPQRAESVIP